MYGRRLSGRVRRVRQRLRVGAELGGYRPGVGGHDRLLPERLDWPLDVRRMLTAILTSAPAANPCFGKHSGRDTHLIVAGNERRPCDRTGQLPATRVRGDTPTVPRFANAEGDRSPAPRGIYAATAFTQRPGPRSSV